ncbi:uncharacterized protein LOC115879398 isoform X2 [Sitophilus oryzae]|uniref:Uncharacterized protein LOC115879398 isoform X2 n=1 Tax=Sitophilus oryzae TaxID=7048 RepID=A0A6J2XN36_SITOR|nr:uncharacterized protein LOC115879398 isoform X2 [Sitophilus oryzae]
MLVKLSLAILCFMAATQSSFADLTFQVRKYDMSNPACKYVLSEIVKLDQSFINLSSLFPSLQFLANKYNAKDDKSYRRKRDLSGMLEIVNSKIITGILEHVYYILDRSDPCLYWIRGYVRFWLEEILIKIIGDNLNKFFD